MGKENQMSAFYEKKADRNSYLYFNKVTEGNKMEGRAHFHDSIELVIMCEGSCSIYINGEECVLGEGDCAFIDRFDVHYYRYREKCNYYVFLVSEKFLNASNGFDKNRLAAFLPRCEKFDKIRNLVESAYLLWETGNETYRSGLANILLGVLSGQYPMIKREIKGEVKVLVDTLLYLNENFDKDITLEHLSDKFGYSKNYFSTLFNRFAGMNLREYINQRRICEFERLRIKETGQPMYALAHQCGFNSLKTFYRAYEKYANS